MKPRIIPHSPKPPGRILCMTAALLFATAAHAQSTEDRGGALTLHEAGGDTPGRELMRTAVRREAYTSAFFGLAVLEELKLQEAKGPQ